MPCYTAYCLYPLLLIFFLAPLRFLWMCLEKSDDFSKVASQKILYQQGATFIFISFIF